MAGNVPYPSRHKMTRLPARLQAGGDFTMSVSGISSSSFFNVQNANLQNQQQWQQQVQKLGQELQASSLSAPQVATQTALVAQQPASPASSSPTAPSGTPATPIPNVPQGTHRGGIHAHTPHHLVSADDNSDSLTQDSNPLGQTLPDGSSSTAQQAYSAWQKDLQQVALNSDLLTAQGADWQPVSISA